MSREILLPKVDDLNLEELVTGRVLIITWDATIDMLKFKTSYKVVLETKRGVSSAIGLVFDPLELIDPVIVK